VTRLATDLPAPRGLTDEDLRRLNELGRELSRIVGQQTAKMEQLTGEDMAVVVGGPGCSCRR